MASADNLTKKADDKLIRSPINVAHVDRKINASLRKQIVDIINKHPDLALSIIRGWKDRRD